MFGQWFYCHNSERNISECRAKVSHVHRCSSYINENGHQLLTITLFQTHKISIRVLNTMKIFKWNFRFLSLHSNKTLPSLTNLTKLWKSLLKILQKKSIWLKRFNSSFQSHTSYERFYLSIYLHMSINQCTKHKYGKWEQILYIAQKQVWASARTNDDAAEASVLVKWTLSGETETLRFH